MPHWPRLATETLQPNSHEWHECWGHVGGIIAIVLMTFHKLGSGSAINYRLWNAAVLVVVVTLKLATSTKIKCNKAPTHKTPSCPHGRGLTTCSGTLTAGHFQKVWNLLVLDDQLGKVHPSTIRLTASIWQIIRRMRVLNNILCLWIHNLNIIIEL